MRDAAKRLAAILTIGVTSAAASQQFAPPLGYSGPAPSRAAVPPEPGAPALIRLPDQSLSGLFRLEPRYRRIDDARVKVVGAFTVEPPRAVRLIGGWGPGFLPVTLSFSDGRCFRLSADYAGGTLSNGRLNRSACDTRPGADPYPMPPPPERALRFIGASFGHAAWADDRTGRTIITAPSYQAFEPLIIADLRVDAITALGGPDYPGSNITVIGRWRGKPTVVTLDVRY